jgi:hypothetical protein
MEKVPKQLEVRPNAKKSLAESSKAAKFQNGVGMEVVRLHTVVCEYLDEERRCGEGKPAFEERGEEDAFVVIGLWRTGAMGVAPRLLGDETFRFDFQKLRR